MNQRLIILILATAILLLGGYVVYLLKDARQTADQYEAIIQEKSDKVTYYKNREGVLIAEKASAAISHANAQLFYAAELARVKKDFDLKTKEMNQLKSFFEAGILVQDSGTSVITPRFNGDSTKKIRDLQVADGYLNFKADVTTDTATWKYNYTDTLTAIGLIKKFGFLGLGRQDYFIRAKLQNKKAMITSVKSFRIEEFKTKRFGLGVGVGYAPLVPGPPIQKIQVTFGVHYDLLQF